MGKRRDREIKRYLKDEVKARLEYDPNGVFSRTEVMRTFRNLLHGHDAEKKDELLKLRDRGDINRRQFLKALGFGMGGAVVASSGLGYFMGKKVFDERTHHPTGYATLNVSPGDEIGSAINSQLSDGTELHIPEGTYTWNDSIDFTGSDASVIGDGNVVFERPSDKLRLNCEATNGTVAFKNFTVKGPAGGCDKAKMRFQAQSGATVRVENVRQPDGTQASDSEVVGMYSPRDHAGTVQYVACECQGFGNNGLYASSMGKYTDGSSKHGTIEVIGGFYRNNNIANVRVGGDDFLVKDVIILHNENAPERCKGGRNQRGIRIDGHGENGRIENVHFTVDGVSNSTPLICSDNADGGSCTAQNLCIRNENGKKAINTTSKASGYSLSGDGLILRGGGNLSHDGDWSNVCEGSSCDECQEQEMQIGDIPIGSSGGGDSAPC